MSYYRACRLAVEVEVARGVAQGLLREAQDLTILSEDGASQGVGRSVVDELTLFNKSLGGIRRIVVDVNGDYWAEQLGAHEFVIRIGRDVYRWVNEESFLAIVFATSDTFEFRIVLGLIDDLLQLVEALLMNDWADEVIVLLRATCRSRLLACHLQKTTQPRAALDVYNAVPKVLSNWRLTDLQFFRLLNKSRLYLTPKALREVSSACSTAFLTLILESSAHSIDHDILDIGAIVDEVIVLAASLANDARI